MYMPTVLLRYLTQCKTNNQPPGLGDFLRGMTCIMSVALHYNYNVKLDYKSHPVFDFLKKNNEYIPSIEDDKMETLELIPPKSYETIKIEIVDLFNKNTSFALMTNSFNVVEPSYESLKKMREIFVESDEIAARINAFILTKLKSKPYVVFQIRTGDEYMNDNKLHEVGQLNKYMEYIKNIKEELGDVYELVVITDSIALKQILIDNNIITSSGLPTHTGDLKNKNDLSDTLFDFFLMSHANSIISKCDFGTSGFSKMVNIIFGIPFKQF